MARDYRRFLGLDDTGPSFALGEFGQPEPEMPMLPTKIGLPGDPSAETMAAPLEQVVDEVPVAEPMNRTPAVMPQVEPPVALAPAPVVPEIKPAMAKPSINDLLNGFNGDLAEAQRKRENNQNIALGATSANDVATNLMKMIPGATPIAKPGWIDELKRTEDKDMVALKEKMALPGQVLAQKTAEKQLGQVMDPNTDAAQKEMYVQLLAKHGFSPEAIRAMPIERIVKTFGDLSHFIPKEMTEADKERIGLGKAQLKELERHNGAMEGTAKTKAEAAASKAGSKPGMLDQARDREFGKEAVKWMAGDRQNLDASINELNSIVKDLQKSGTVTGKTQGFMTKVPLLNSMLAPEATDLRERVERVIQKDLRQTLGAQFTEKEGENLLKRTYNPSLPEATNIARLNKLISVFSQIKKDKDDAVDYADKNGTLKGFSGRDVSSIVRADDILPESSLNVSSTPVSQSKPTSIGQSVKVRAPDGSIRMIPKSQVDAALKAGGSLAE